MEKIGFIGSGNMAEALIKGIIASGLYESKDVYISDIRSERLQQLKDTYNVTACKNNIELVGQAGTVVLSVKPQNMKEVLQGIKNEISNVKLFISIAAGVRISRISEILGNIAIVRVMPNTPALIGQGASALFTNEKAQPMQDKALTIFSSVGKAVVVENEDLLDAVTAVSGSGPAYFFLLMEEMLKAAIELGLPQDAATELVLQTAKGAGMLAFDADKTGQSPALLRQKVTSPGGTTEAALKVLAQSRFDAIVLKAIEKARDKSRELSG